MSEEDIDDKEHEPTQKRLDDARARGEVIQSPDLTGAAAYAGLILTGAAAGVTVLIAFGTASTGLLAAADTVAADLTQGYAAPVT
jgi:flagellar biosynthesis protein FlhB